MSDPKRSIDRHIDYAEREGIELAALMMSPPAFDYFRKEAPESTDSYRSVPIHLHDEWSWGWMLRAKDGSFVNVPVEKP